MSKRASKNEQMQRIEEIAYLMDEMSIEELAEYAGVSIQTIKRDIKYIKSHWKQFFN